MDHLRESIPAENPFEKHYVPPYARSLDEFDSPLRQSSAQKGAKKEEDESFAKTGTKGKA